ncbi:ImmA/IrrE family metallo-endopeptidase [Lysinibacillus cavernae]|uniref:ImmA/IrrE family metallo-endopeptidase n=1 Tax=Lysinibacillus cavernae TaxID=2666135 RepID=UPI0012D8B78C|nr:ImmA/IrrE family metallo-endopeptidase [Lysinibacillus cavernae]
MHIPRERKIAKRLIDKYGLTPPIDIESFIRSYANVEEDDLPENVDAICMMNVEQSTIIIDRFQSSNRKRFTLAHELGHLCIPWHCGMISCHTDINDNISHSEYEKMENEANNFAAEILMPTDWLVNKISENPQDISLLISEVATEANVSRSAAFFNIWPLLDDGYVFKIYNKFRGYTTYKKTNTEFFISYLCDEGMDGIEEYSTNKDTCILDDFIIDWWYFENSLPPEKIQKYIDNINKNGLKWIVNDLQEFGPTTLLNNLNRVVNQLPSGYFSMVLLKNGKCIDFNQPKNSKIAQPYFNTIPEAKRWVKDNCKDYGGLQFGEICVMFGNFDISSSIEVNDKRNSKLIFNQILEECYYDIDEKEKNRRCFNGVIGSLNSSNSSKDFDSFYLMMKQRIKSDGRFDLIIRHSLYESFVKNKINEILLKKNK